MQLCIDGPNNDIGSQKHNHIPTTNSSNLKLFKFIGLIALVQGLLLIFLIASYTDNASSTNTRTISKETSSLRKFNISIERSKNKTKDFINQESFSTSLRTKDKNSSNDMFNYSITETINETILLVNGPKLSMSNCNNNNKIDEKHKNLTYLRSELSCRNNDNITQPKTINFLSCTVGIKCEYVLPMCTFLCIIIT